MIKFEHLIQKVNELYEFRDHYFDFHDILTANEKQEKIEEKLKYTLNEIDQFLLLKEKNETNCNIDGKTLRNDPDYLFLKGKALNVLEAYNPEAEGNFSKAVKLNPSLSEAWICLGECFWKKGQIESAKNCFLSAINHKRDKVALRNLSMVTRSSIASFSSSSQEHGNKNIGINTNLKYSKKNHKNDSSLLKNDQKEKDWKEKLEILELSLKLAKEALEMDLSDGMSWMVLGNAYLAKFFMNKQEHKIMIQCMSAYKMAEKDPIAEKNYDLHYNKATLLHYKEEYKEALMAYSRSSSLEPNFIESKEKYSNILSYLDKLIELILNKGKIKLKKMDNLLKSFENQNKLNMEINSCISKNFSGLSLGLNLKTYIRGSVVALIITEESTCFTLCIVDSHGDCLGVTVYNIASSWGVKIRDIVTILEPLLKWHQFEFKNENYDFKNIRVDSPLCILINGKKVSSNDLIPTTFTQFVKSQ